MFSRLWILVWLISLTLCTAANEPRPIRLRNEHIVPNPSEARARSGALAADPSASLSTPGLVLIQFTGPVQAEWQAELTSKGVELLHFVPDDAFVAHLSAQALTDIQTLSFVHWTGPYLPRHKIASQVLTSFAANGLTNLPVKLLVRSGAPQSDLANVIGSLASLRHHHTLQFGTFIEGSLHAYQLRRLAESPAVLWIETRPQMQMVDEISTKMVAGDTFRVGSFAHVHELGYNGRGVTVAVADSGFDLGDLEIVHFDFEGRVDALFAYDNLPDASDEHSHGTHCAGIIAGDAAIGETDESGYLYGLGVAPGSHIVGQRIFDRDGQYRPPPSFEHLTRDAVRSGAYVGSNSWGDANQGRYDLTAAEFDALVRDADALTPGNQQYILEFSAGNSGPGRQTIGTPAVAKNVIATGASQSDRSLFGLYSEGSEMMADFSSRGPCEDGRIKPDIVAPGTWIASQKSQASTDANAWLPISPNYLYQGGTSQAGPHVSGACAVFVQWYRENRGGTPSPALVKAALINSADDMTTAEIIIDPDDPFGGGFIVGDTGPLPNNDEGWGRLNLETLIDSTRRFDFTDQNTLLSSGQTWEKRIVVGPDDQLKVTLVYTDVPGLPATIPALVNDLDLEVVSPTGLIYRGNAFADGESFADTPIGDRINNVEGVHISEPTAGEYIVRVRAINILQDALGRSIGIPQQDFAIVASGQFPLPGEGVVSWDRLAYQSPAMASVRLVDQTLGQTSVATVDVTSTTQSTPLTLTLDRIPGGNTYTGTVQLVTGTTGNTPGALAANHGDTLTLRYVDADPPGERRATSRVDNQPPLLSDIAANKAFGRTTITWVSSEPSNGRVVFGTTNDVNEVVFDPAYRQRHSLLLPVLEPDTTYFYYIVATDLAGNTVTNDNQGRFHRFVAPRTAAALLVYTSESLFAPDGLLGETPYPGIETWLDPLMQLDLDFEVWNTTERGATPTLDELIPYRLVLWRPEELFPPTTGLVLALENYVKQGGSLFTASFDLLTRLGEIAQSTFTTNILQVLEYQEDRGAYFVMAERGDPIAAGMDLELDYSEFPSGFFIDILGIDWPSGPDHLLISTNASPVFRQEDGRVVGLRYPRTGADSQGRVVFLSFPLEAVPAQGPAPNNRTSLVGNAIEFLIPGLQGGSSIALNRSAYTVPGSVFIEVSDARRTGEAMITVKATSTTQPDPVDVLCFETPVRGIFRGQLVLNHPPEPLPSNADRRSAELADDPPPPPDVIARLAARHGDLLVVTYVDAIDRQLQTDADIDTNPPSIFSIEIDPAYNEALVYWETDKETDALVRFGETGGDESFLNRSAYSAELSTWHEVLVRGLQPDREYFFNVTSRDAAGNAVTDNNNGQLYKFRTLAPIHAPWFDDLEEARPGWIVFTDPSLTGGFDDDADFGFMSSRWAYGVPSNRFGVDAFSGQRCWATNLRGEISDFAITDLISPAINLAGGNRATLSFWHYYNFSTETSGEDDFGDFTIEIAQIAITTNNGATWSVIYSPLEESSEGWREEIVDLTRYLGQVIRLRFNYQMFSFSTRAHLGWFIDDVGIDINVVPETLLKVTNNLAQATFTLEGPTTVEGTGRLLSTNLPPGDYSITWHPVQDYLTPEPQSATLGVSPDPLVFSGNYTFPNLHEDGISDLWKQRHFGNIDPRPWPTDSDNDGVPDINEFRAGTDPTDPDSFFAVEFPQELPNRTVRVQWPTVPGREYLLEGSIEVGQWVPFAEPMRATGDFMSVTLPALDARLTYLFRVLVWP